MEIIGTVTSDLEVQKMELKPVFNNNVLKGLIIYVDNYGNAFSNITKEQFYKLKRNSFQLCLEEKTKRLLKSQVNTRMSQLLKSLLYLEKIYLLQIAINQGQANKLLGLNLHETIRVEFK